MTKGVNCELGFNYASSPRYNAICTHVNLVNALHGEKARQRRGQGEHAQKVGETLDREKASGSVAANLVHRVMNGTKKADSAGDGRSHSVRLCCGRTVTEGDASVQWHQRQRPETASDAIPWRRERRKVSADSLPLASCFSLQTSHHTGHRSVIVQIVGRRCKNAKAKYKFKIRRSPSISSSSHLFSATGEKMREHNFDRRPDQMQEDPSRPRACLLSKGVLVGALVTPSSAVNS